MGNPNGEIAMRNIGGVGAVYGGTLPARIWEAFMRAAMAPLPHLGFAPPDESRWGRPSSVSELGRRVNFNIGPRRPSATVPLTPTTGAGATVPTPTTEPVTPTTKKKPTPTTVASPGP
jgi:hypothetical protein